MSARIKIVPNDLRRLVEAGHSTAEIAAFFGVRSPAVIRSCHAHGFPLPHGGRKRAGWHAPDPTRKDDERDLAILRRVLRGDGIRFVAARFAMSNKTVQRIVQQIEAADIAESGEPVLAVARHYASPRRRRA